MSNVTLTPIHFLAVTDTLVLKALEAVGKRLVRADRSRFRRLDGRPFYVAHTIWQADDETTLKALRGAWDVLPSLIERHGPVPASQEDLEETLTGYVMDLVITGTPHTIEGLVYRLRSRAGVLFEEEVAER